MSMNIKALYEGCTAFAYRHQAAGELINPAVVRRHLNELASADQRLDADQKDPARLVFVARYVGLPGFNHLVN